MPMSAYTVHLGQNYLWELYQYPSVPHHRISNGCYNQFYTTSTASAYSLEIAYPNGAEDRADGYLLVGIPVCPFLPLKM